MRLNERVRFGCVAWLALVAMVGCAADFDVEPEDHRARPLARPGPGSTYLVGATVTLDGTASLDLDGAIVAYQWSFDSLPLDSETDFADKNAATTTFVADVAGSYQIDLVVSDTDGLKDAARTWVLAFLPQLAVDAGADQAVSARTAVSLSGSVTVETGFSATVEWSIVSKPATSTATLGTTTALTTSFVPDTDGVYLVRLTASTPYNSVSDDVLITATVPRQMLPYVPIDTEYSTALDRFVILSDSPPRVHIHDPATGTEQVIALGVTPISISLRPDGLRAAVGYSNAIHIFDLPTRTLVGVHSLPTTSLTDVVYGADNRVHVFTNGSFTYVYTVNLATNVVTTQTGGSIGGQVYGGMHGRLHPDGVKMYGIDGGGISPGDIHRFDVSTSPITYVRNSPYFGEYPIAYELWFNAAGDAAITLQGNVFNISDNASTDMTFRTRLPQGAYAWISDSAAAGKLATVQNDATATTYLMGLYDDQTYAQISVRPIPKTPFGGIDRVTYGRWVAWRSDASAIYALCLLVDQPAGVIYEYQP